MSGRTELNRLYGVAEILGFFMPQIGDLLKPPCEIQGAYLAYRVANSAISRMAESSLIF